MNHKRAYLIVICNKETNAVEGAAVWSSPEWEQSRCLPQPTFVAYGVRGDTYAGAQLALLQTIAIPNHRYHWLVKYLPPDLQALCVDPTQPKSSAAAIVGEAKRFAEARRAAGFTREDAAAELLNTAGVKYTREVKFSGTDRFGCGPAGEDDVYTVQEFREACDQMSFTDSDGYGYPVKDRKACVEICVFPSDLSRIPDDATHIVWFNA